LAVYIIIHKSPNVFSHFTPRHRMVYSLANMKYVYISTHRIGLCVVP